MLHTDIQTYIHKQRLLNALVLQVITIIARIYRFCRCH